MGLVHLLGALALSAASALAPARGPVATAAAWKAVDLGAPRVIKVDDGYTLFYEYRAVEDAGNADMPPAMSTGRIGRATSDDGLVFTPRADGLGAAGSVLSASDDWFAFDSGHVGLGDVLWGGDAQFLYTYGGSNAPVARSELGLDGDGDVVGMDLKMGVCVSQDGVHWGRIEGDEADFSVLGDGPADCWERRGAAVAWPTVVSREGEFLLFYCAAAAAGGARAVGVATSKNGLRWTRADVRAPCLSPGPAGSWDRGGILRRTVLGDGAGGWLMFYEAVDGAGTARVGRATSGDGRDWTKSPDGPVFAPAGGDAWDAASVAAPCVIRLDGGGLRMYYAGRADAASPAAFGVASSDDEGVTWAR